MVQDLDFGRKNRSMARPPEVKATLSSLIISIWNPPNGITSKIALTSHNLKATREGVTPSALINWKRLEFCTIGLWQVIDFRIFLLIYGNLLKEMRGLMLDWS